MLMRIPALCRYGRNSRRGACIKILLLVGIAIGLTFLVLFIALFMVVALMAVFPDIINTLLMVI